MATITRRNQANWLIARLLADNRFQLLTYSATKNMIETFRAEMDTPSSARTVFGAAKTLASKPGADCEETLREALVGYPELVVTLIPSVIEMEKMSACRPVVFFVGNQIMYGIEQIMERAECLLSKYVLPQEPSPAINRQFITALKEAERRLENTSNTYSRFGSSINFIDAYEKHQISLLEGEGGICID